METTTTSHNTNTITSQKNTNYSNIIQAIISSNDFINLINKIIDSKLNSLSQLLSDFKKYKSILEEKINNKASKTELSEAIQSIKDLILIIRDEINKRLDQVDKRFEELLHYIDKRFEELIHYIDKRIEDEHRFTEKRFEDMNKRFDDMNKRFDDMMKMFQKLFWLIVSLYITIGISMIGMLWKLLHG